MDKNHSEQYEIVDLNELSTLEDDLDYIIDLSNLPYYALISLLENKKQKLFLEMYKDIQE